MRKFVQNIVTIITITAGIVAVLSFVYQVKSDNPKIEILEINNDNLTNIPRIKNLTANFSYKDSVITNLWKLNAVIKNVGSKTIIGKGTNKNIIENHIGFKLNEGFRLIDFNIAKAQFPNEIKKDSNSVRLFFSQWREDEQIDVTIYAEQISNASSELKIIGDERDIVDGEITYRKINQQVNQRKNLADYLPESISAVLLWIGIIVYALCSLILPFGMIYEVYKYFMFGSWKRKWNSKFNENILRLYKEKELAKIYSPNNLPDSYWEKINVPKPDLPMQPFASTFLGMLVLLILLILPLLWLIKI
ncbi:hypothetical protein FLCU109888_03735 [Flavobacterium cucumis]|uniref:Uncharacterized protein n=1 Tax=Flavobacterium cucumis TaxID=416016 RepID=A0A1M7ZV06_9FLAO|nr:hypothetical protein [Flavobacterium cucumis]SHO72704.1 hypothetical protein SAMN05443547_1042 [Flavobacterium cucumis]